MANSGKTLQTRIQLKHDTNANWTTAGNNSFIPLNGEIIVYDDLGPKIKIGDGTTNVKDLNWAALTPTEVNNGLALKVAKAGDTMTGKLAFNMSNPHIEMKDTAYNTLWYFQAYQDQLAFGPTFASAVKTDKTGNMTVPGIVKGNVFKSDDSTSAIKPSDSNEINFGSNTNYIYFGYDNRIGSAGVVDTYQFGRSNGLSGATDGDIICGSVSMGRYAKIANKVTMQYNSTTESLDFVFA